MTKTTTTDADGTRFEWDPETGETGLFYPNGQYFRSDQDYDHGWVFRNPGMTYSQIRRSSWGTFWSRASMVFMAVCFVILPMAWAITISSLDDYSLWIAIPAYVTLQSLAGIIFIKKVVESELFDFVWRARLPEKNRMSS